MKRIAVLLLWSLAGWYVVTYSGQAVAGPFADYNNCQAEAQRMSRIYMGVSPYCQAR